MATLIKIHLGCLKVKALFSILKYRADVTQVWNEHCLKAFQHISVYQMHVFQSKHNYAQRMSFCACTVFIFQQTTWHALHCSQFSTERSKSNLSLWYVQLYNSV